MKYPYFRGLEADRYSFYRVPKALIKVDLFEKMSGDAKLLYAVLLDRMNLSLKNGWQDENGNAYIICTIDEIMDSIRCARQKAVKLLDELEHEYQLIERRRQGLGKPNLLYVKDLYADQSYIKNGSMLDSDTANETGKTQEDVEANAFAGLLLMPDQLLSNQIDLFGIDKDDMDTDSVLSLMDMFAIPYKATVLRLYESNCIKRHKAEELFRVTAEDVAKRVELTGKAKRWQLDGSGTESFGTLLEKADYNTEHDYLTESREKENWKYISELKKELGMD